jgi:hypothetical protein
VTDVAVNAGQWHVPRTPRAIPSSDDHPLPFLHTTCGASGTSSPWQPLLSLERQGLAETSAFQFIGWSGEVDTSEKYHLLNILPWKIEWPHIADLIKG